MNVVYIVSVWPEPQTSGASQRVMQLVTLLKQAGFKLTVVSDAKKTSSSVNLNKLDIATAEIQLNNNSFNAYIKKINPNIVFFDRFMSEEKYGWRVHESAPQALRILDTVDFHTLREARAKQREGKIENLQLHNETSLREIASIYRCDLSLFVADYEIDILKSQFNIPSHLLFYHPLTIQDNTIISQKTFSMKKGFLAIGSFLHPPNWDSVLQLKHTLWPQIRMKLKDVNLYIVGSYTPEKARLLHNEKEGFIIEGFAQDDFKRMEEARIHLAPLRFGAGIKSKCVLAFKAGTPTVTFNIGAEGLCPSSNWAGSICHDKESFVKAAIDLYSNEKSFNQAQSKGFEIAEYFKDNKWFKKLVEKINHLYLHKNTNRDLNFVGKMLRHHQNLSCRYLSKWIEEKNKSS